MKMREFEGGATRDTNEDKLDPEGFLSPIVIERYEDYVYKQEQIAWAAGLFEGEGCIRLNKEKGRKRKDGTYNRPGGYFYPQLRMVLTDEDVIRKFAIIVGGFVRGPYIPKNKLSKKSFWTWQVQGELALKISQLFVPYLGCRRFAKLYETFGISKNAQIYGISPIVLESYSKYLHKHRIQADGKLRDSDNWQRGIPIVAYMESKWRHFLATWLIHRGYDAFDEKGNKVDIKESLCAEIFNTMGYLYELLKKEEEQK